MLIERSSTIGKSDTAASPGELASPKRLQSARLDRRAACPSARTGRSTRIWRLGFIERDVRNPRQKMFQLGETPGNAGLEIPVVIHPNFSHPQGVVGQNIDV